MIRPLPLAACSALLLAATPLPAFAQPQAAPADAAALLASVARDFAGVAFVVMEPDGRSHEGALGHGADGAPFAAETPVALYSVAKPMTATLAMMLMAEGAVDLDRPIGETVEVPAAWRDATLRQLLGHASGMRHYRDAEWLRLSRRHCATTSDALTDFIADPPAGPRGAFFYSTLGYVLASHVLANAAGRDFPGLIAERVFAPAGMDARVWTDGAAVPPNGFEGRNGRFRPARAIDNSCKYGAGAVTGSAADLARFGAALTSGRLMPVERARLMLESPVAGGRYGLGWGLSALPDGTPIASHTGSGIGGTSAIAIDLNSGRVAAVVANGEGPSLGPLAAQLLRRDPVERR
jgi:CubicO group peptidase (beta-lactamase class C family)